MDLTSLSYFVELARDPHMTKTAERLFISQQTLSNHIRRLEAELGTPLFNRKPSLSLTHAGELVYQFAQGVEQNHARLVDSLADIEGQVRGVLRIGGSAFRLNACLPEILPVFSRKYPQVELRITDAITSTLEPMILDDKLDIAIVVASAGNARMRSVGTIHEQLYLCVTNELLESYYGNDAESIKQRAQGGAFVQDFDRLPFCMMSNRMGRQLQNCFEEAGITPHVYTTSTYTRIGLALCEKSLAACVVSQMSLFGRRVPLSPDVNIFPLRCRNGLLYLPLSLIQKADRTLPLYANYFLDLLTQYFYQIEQTTMTRVSEEIP